MIQLTIGAANAMPPMTMATTTTTSGAPTPSGRSFMTTPAAVCCPDHAPRLVRFTEASLMVGALGVSDRCHLSPQAVCRSDQVGRSAEYFREPGGVLYEIATLGPGFATDEDPAHLGRTSSCRRRSSICARRSSRSSPRCRILARAGVARETARARASGERRAARVRSSCCTVGAPTSTTFSRCSTRSTPSDGCTGTRRVPPLVPAAGRRALVPGPARRLSRPANVRGRLRRADRTGSRRCRFGRALVLGGFSQAAAATRSASGRDGRGQ